MDGPEDGKDGTARHPRKRNQTTFDSERAKAARRRGAELARERGLSLEKLGALAPGDLALCRHRLLAALKRGGQTAREETETLKLFHSVTQTIMDRVEGKPRAVAASTVTPEEYRLAVETAKARAAQESPPADDPA